MYRFLLSPRWLAVSVLVLIAVPFCVFMGSWQLSRFQARVEQHANARHERGAAAAGPAVPLVSVLPGVRSQVTGDDIGRAVSATGRYDAGHQLLVPGRTLGGRTGFYVLTPLRVGGGAALPVVRGWLPGDASAAGRARSVPAAPGGEVTVIGALQYPESSGTSGLHSAGALPPGQLGMISAASLVNVLPYPVYGGWLTALQTAAPLTAVPPAAPPNSGLDLKAFQNLGYTGQWFVFAGFVVFMWFRLVRREAEARADAALGLVPDDALAADEDRGPDPDRTGQDRTGQDRTDPERDPHPGPGPGSGPGAGPGGPGGADVGSPAHVA